MLKICGKGKIVFNTQPPFDIKDAENFHTTYKKHLTKIFFALEKCILNWRLSSQNCVAFSDLLFRNEPFSKNSKLNKDIAKLKKYCFNGTLVLDEVTENGQTSIFTVKDFVSVMENLKNLLRGNENYSSVVSLISELGEKMICFGVIRLIEESYKVLDKGLFIADKLHAKIETLKRLEHRFISIGTEYFDLGAKLIDKPEIDYVVNACHFSDLLPRRMSSALLKIVKITSENFISVGEQHSTSKQLCFALVDVEREQMNTINGISPLEMDLEVEKYYSPNIAVCNVTV